jgi:hypothetical protein
MMNWERFGKKLLWSNEGTILEFILRIEENYEKLQPG